MKTFKKVMKFLLSLIVIVIFIYFVVYLFSGKNEIVLNKPHIKVIKLEGIIVDSEKIVRELRKAEENDFVKGVIIRINSPGGAVAPSQEIYKAIRKVKKPVYAAISTLGASGGYYVAAACDKIYVLGGSITGSIGVIMRFSNFKELYDKIGVKFESIKSGKFKDIGSSSREMSKEERELLQKAIDNVYKQFVNDILKTRHISKDIIKKYADGRILTGEQALKLGFVDKIGTYYDAFEDMKKDFHLGEDVVLYEVKDKNSLLKELLEGVSKVRLLFNNSAIFYYLYE
ncbi:signal peptide peptidase SppA [Deferribacter desulfuricans SSM1]|uniref:Signal peptide peptidase SppA n=1 Tax=Deferribacter desulfuricans (strain DSM 14783 / JCM 11476 / NBRC 101012 / SSM1) TaxID=639282 RepID=D3PA01_DEFDS|nr:signal peptide peptidase SppA [Deferribacter desulfuricans]BAI81541.1 signal peptide peptidase SppA [Deferribacter desulfuricans SSM1]